MNHGKSSGVESPRVFLLAGVLAAVGVAVLVPSCRSKPGLKAAVQCSKHQAGIQCTVNHQKGKVKGNVCWDVTLVCRNGTEVKGGGCQTVEPEGRANKTIPKDELPELEECDRVVMTKIVNVRMLKDVDG